MKEYQLPTCREPMMHNTSIGNTPKSSSSLVNNIQKISLLNTKRHLRCMKQYLNIIVGYVHSIFFIKNDVTI